jgi:hypothetical protein
MNKLLLNIGRISAGLGVAGTVLAASLVTGFQSSFTLLIFRQLMAVIVLLFLTEFME